MPTLAALVRLYEEHAEACIHTAAETDNPKRRDLLLKFAMQWREDAQALRRGAGASQGSPRKKKRPLQG
jgi:hypothetical protein